MESSIPNGLQTLLFWFDVKQGIVGAKKFVVQGSGLLHSLKQELRAEKKAKRRILVGKVPGQESKLDMLDLPGITRDYYRGTQAMLVRNQVVSIHLETI